MVKKRPRSQPPRVAGIETQAPSKLEPAFWQGRLFKNTFTYQGRSVAVKGWSVKIQLFGQRKSFALGSSDPVQAAAEACQIYQTIATQGWDAVRHRRAKGSFPARFPQATLDAAPPVSTDLEQWKPRLIHRKYPEPTHPPGRLELSARIEHADTRRYFPLGTDDETEAAAAAMRIHQAIVHQGWAVANQIFSRELTLAFRWLDDPLAWTYTTFHTCKTNRPFPAAADPRFKPAVLNVAIIEPDAGIRLALTACVNQQDGFNCCGAYAGTAEALRVISRQRVDLLLTNFALPDQPGSACVAAMQGARPGLIGLLYSVFEDSDELFKATPGGAAGYLLKRTPPSRIFEPIANATGPLTREFNATRIREYFQRLVAAMPAGPSALELAKLSPREHEILALLSKGNLAKEIADTLGISIWTVQGHVKSILEKLKVHTRTEAVVKFLHK